MKNFVSLLMHLSLIIFFLAITIVSINIIVTSDLPDWMKFLLLK